MLSNFHTLTFRGHNGIKSIIATIGGNDFRRLHLGIDRPKSSDPDIVAGYVLSNFKSDDLMNLRENVFPKVFAFLKK